MIGMVICDPVELKYLGIEQMPSPKEVGTFQIYEFQINKKDIKLIIAKIGLPQAAAATQTLLLEYPEISEVYNIGAVGAKNGELEVYDIVVPKYIYYYGVKTPWYPYGQIPGQKPFFTNALITEEKQVKKSNLSSGMSFIDSSDSFKEVEKYKVEIVDMEAAAIINIATNFGIPCKIIKCVSDVVGRTNVSTLEKIDTRIEKAAEKAYKFAISII